MDDTQALNALRGLVADIEALASDLDVPTSTVIAIVLVMQTQPALTDDALRQILKRPR